MKGPVRHSLGEGGWAKRFERPIDVGGKTLITLRDAIAWLARRPKAHHQRPDIQLAAQLVTHAAEQGGIMLMAEIAVRRVANQETPPPADPPRRKRAKKYRVLR